MAGPEDRVAGVLGEVGADGVGSVVDIGVAVGERTDDIEGGNRKP